VFAVGVRELGAALLPRASNGVGTIKQQAYGMRTVRQLSARAGMQEDKGVMLSGQEQTG